MVYLSHSFISLFKRREGRTAPAISMNAAY